VHILIGPGIFHIVEVNELPQDRDELPLASALLTKGVYQVNQKGTQEWGGETYNYFTHTRIGDVPSGTKTLPIAVMNV